MEEEEDDDNFAPGPGPWESASNGRMAENFAFLVGIDSVPAAPIVPKKPKGKTLRPRSPWKTREDALIAKSKGGKDGKTPTKKKHRVSSWLPADRDWAASDGEGKEEKAEVKEEKKEEEIEEKKDEVKDEEREAEKEKKDEAEEA